MGEFETKQRSLYERLGGETAVAAVVDHFYGRILADNSVNGFFSNTDMERQKRHQTAFVTMATGGPNRYSGRSMKQAHEGLSLTAEHFNSVVGHLVETLRHFQVSEADIAELGAKLMPLKDDIVARP